MFYAIRRRAGSDRQTLVEFATKADMDAASVSKGNVYSNVRATIAREWVRRGREHETAFIWTVVPFAMPIRPTDPIRGAAAHSFKQNARRFGRATQESDSNQRVK